MVLARQGETLTNLKWKAFRVPAGSYLVTLNGMVSNPTSSGVGWFTCVLADAERTFRPNADPNMGGVMAGAQADFSKDVSDGVFGMSNVYTIAARHRVAYACQGGAGTGSVKAQAPITATLRKVNRPATKVGTKYTPPRSELKGDLRNLLD
ncbi:hypothetical protein [Nocardioides speluncae]|uniref:hypothetical protein n=1 Tax=Nocardioides speluncae TaxID=2670337 RepID=UPI00137A6216|nr:hypothetical protein [Nocardioides speluncae]